jgi:hypothetical protein
VQCYRKPVLTRYRRKCDATRRGDQAIAFSIQFAFESDRHDFLLLSSSVYNWKQWVNGSFQKLRMDDQIDIHAGHAGWSIRMELWMGLIRVLLQISSTETSNIWLLPPVKKKYLFKQCVYLDVLYRFTYFTKYFESEEEKAFFFNRVSTPFHCKNENIRFITITTTFLRRGVGGGGGSWEVPLVVVETHTIRRRSDIYIINKIGIHICIH